MELTVPRFACAAIRHLLRVLLGLCCLALPANATWSIVIVDRSTGEVCVATATCLGNFDLQKWVPVIVVGKGGAAAQATLDSLATQRRRIRDGLRRDLPPQSMLDFLEANVSSYQSRQYGVASFSHPPATHTGTNNGVWAGGLTGEVGDLSYSIQGNVLTGQAVIDNAEQALLQSTGDLSQRVMAVMEAARVMGGDGRCSCNGPQADSCGAPPPSFTKSAHVACIVLGRMGDTDGVCSGNLGCVSGSYFLKLQFQGLVADPDPVIMLQGLYDTWRQGKQGHPDHIHSTKTASARRLPADGLSTATIDVHLFDIEGMPLTQGGAALSLSTSDGSPAHASVGSIQDHGDGSYTIEMIAGMEPGVDEWRIDVDDGSGPVALYPWVKLAIDPVEPLHVGFRQVHSAEPELVPFTLNAPTHAGRAYFLLGSASGVAPGQTLAGVHVPLNDDAFFQLTRTQAGSSLLPGSLGVLDAAGRASCEFAPPPGFLTPYVGGELDWAAMIFDASGNVVLGPVGFEVRP